MQKLLLGLDIGSSSVKASLVNVDTGKSVSSAQSPAEEMLIYAAQPGWAEQDPDVWWEHTLKSVRMCLATSGADPRNVEAIGISYQMHGLVVVAQDHKPLRPAIIWCDSRAVSLGEKAFESLGKEYCLKHFLNSPGNFTASKLRWIKEHEPSVYEKIYKMMLPGDYIAMCLSGEIVTTDTGLSEGVFWDYQSGSVSEKLLHYYGIDRNILPQIKPVFSVQGIVRKEVAEQLGLKSGVKISYRAGDQPNNAFSLNVLNPGETAATAGTSGVIYTVTDKHAADIKSRLNTFVHVNNADNKISNGVLLCVNGTGILNSWLRKNISTGSPFEYAQMNELAKAVPIGSEGLSVLPFGNGAERILENRMMNASFHGLDFNVHHQAHLFRASQEGIVFALKYGFDILQSMGLKTTVIRAGHTNMFLSPVFREAFVNSIGAPLELYNTNGATGAALGAGVGAGIFGSFTEAFRGLTILKKEEPDKALIAAYDEAYHRWKNVLVKVINP